MLLQLTNFDSICLGHWEKGGRGDRDEHAGGKTIP